MKASELRERIESLRAQQAKLAAEMSKGDAESMNAAFNGAVITGGFFLGEIALQLAELNEKLDVDALFESFKKFGDKVDAMDKAKAARKQ